MPRGHEELVKHLKTAIETIPNAVLFYADEHMLRKYASSIKNGETSPTISFNDYCKSHILSIKTHIAEYKRISEYYKAEVARREEADDDELGFADFVKGRENADILVDLDYILFRFRDLYETEKKTETVNKYKLSPEENPKEIKFIVKEYVDSKMTAAYRVADALPSRLRRGAQTYAAQFESEARGPQLFESLEEKYKQSRRDEIFANSYKTCGDKLESDYLESLSQVNEDTILVASLTDLEIGAKYRDQMPDPTLMNPREKMYGHNYYAIDTGALMAGINLSGTSLKRCHFREVDLTNIDLRDTSLENVRFDDCTLVGADLRGADTAKTSINYCVRSDMELPEGQTKDQYIQSMIHNVLVSSHSVYGINRAILDRDLKSGAVTIDDIIPANPYMDGKSTREFEIMYGASTNEIDIINGRLPQEAAISDDELASVFTCDPVYIRCSGDAVKTKHQATIQDLREFSESGESSLDYSFNDYINEKYQGEGKLYASLAGVDLRELGEMSLQGLNLSYTDFYKTNFSKMDLSRAIFEGANLECADFEDAKLEDTNLINSNATFANFRNANCDLVKFTGAIIDLTDFKGAKLASADLSDCLGRYLNADDTIAPQIIAKHANLEGMSAIGAKMIQGKFAGSNLSRVNFTDADLRDADMSDCIAHNMIMVRANLERATMEGIDARKADFSDAIMRKVQAQNANLSEVVLTRADLTEADLTNVIARGIIDATHADFTKAIMDDIDLRFSNLENAIMEEVKGKRADLRCAVLRHVRAHKAEFIEANMEGVDASFSDFSQAVLTEANLAWSNFVEATLTEANLQLANLRAANLEKANLERASLERANLERASLARANATGANFTGTKIDRDTNLRGTILVGAIGANHLIEQQKEQETSLVSKLFKKFVRNVILGATIAMALYTLPCMLLGSSGSILTALTFGIVGAAVGIVAEPALKIIELAINCYKFCKGLTIDNCLKYTKEKLNEVSHAVGAKVVYTLLVEPPRIDHEVLARSNLESIRIEFNSQYTAQREAVTSPKIMTEVSTSIAKAPQTHVERLLNQHSISMIHESAAMGA